MDYPEETWDIRIYNDLNLKTKNLIKLPDLNITDEQRGALIHKEWT